MATADLLIRFMFSIGRKRRILPSTPLNAFSPSKHWVGEMDGKLTSALHACVYTCLCTRFNERGRKKQARSNKQKGKVTQHTQYVHVMYLVCGTWKYMCIAH